MKGLRLGISNFRALRKDPLGFLARMAREQGDFSQFKIGFHDVFLINHPDLIKDVLVTNQNFFQKGMIHRRNILLWGRTLAGLVGNPFLDRKRIEMPALKGSNLAAHIPQMAETAEQFSKSWKDGQTLNISEEMTLLSIRIAIKSLFSVEVEEEAKEIESGFQKLLKISKKTFLQATGQWAGLPISGVPAFLKIRRRLISVMQRILKSRQMHCPDSKDFVTALLGSQVQDNSQFRMTQRRLTKECLMMLASSYETTAAALAWTWYLLGLYPDSERMFHSEIDEVLGGRLPLLEDLQKLSFSETILFESLRLYPPLWRIARQTLKPWPVRGVIVPTRSTVLLSQYVTHHDPRFFQEPQKFNPNRWTREKMESVEYAFFPFGIGMRRCPGESFAITTILVVLATLAQNWKMRPISNDPVELDLGFLLRPKNKILMRLYHR